MPAESCASCLAVIFMSRTAIAVVTKSSARSTMAAHCTASVTGRGMKRKKPHSKGLANSMVNKARAPHSRQ